MTLMEIELRTLTPLWTGGVDRVCDRVHETGLIGSLRWWYEALVRGLGGYACDPTVEPKCSFDEEKYRKSRATDERQRLREAGLCDVCQAFGATGWARKFRLQVVDGKGEIIEDALTKANTDFVLRFLELREMATEEKWLLVKSVEVAARYGALGGKTTLKPQKDQRKGADYGIVQVKTRPEIAKLNIRAYFNQSNLRPVSVSLPDLRWFFFVKGAFLWRDQMNPLLGLDPKGKPLPNADNIQKFLQGKRGSQDKPAISKKLFSFRAGDGRIWGYAENAQMRDTIIERLRQHLRQSNYTVKTGEEVLNEL